MGHALMENRNGLAVAGGLTHATGTAEREAALNLVDAHRPSRRRITLAADKAYDVAAFMGDLRDRAVTPHIAIDGNVRKSGKPRATAIDQRTTRHAGYRISQVIRKRIEEISAGARRSVGSPGQAARPRQDRGSLHPRPRHLRSHPSPKLLAASP
jgi:hypothetical protein